MTALSTLRAIRSYRAAEIFAALGLAFAISGMESWRVPRVAAAGTGLGSSLLSSSDILVISLVLLALIYWKLRPRLTDNYLVLPIIAFFAAAAIYFHVSLATLSQISPVFSVFALFHAAFSGALFVLWVEVVLNEYAEDLVGFMAFSLAATFLVQLFFVFLSEENLRSFTALIPLLSAVCFVLYRVSIMRREPGAAGASAAGAAETPNTNAVAEPVKLPREPRKHPLAHYAFVCLVWVACGILFAMLFRTWYNSSAYLSGNLYTEIHLFTALGTLVAAAILLVLARPVRRGLLEIIIVAMALAAILLSNMATQVFVVYLIPLNTAQKLIFISIMRSADELENRGNGMALYCVLLGSYRLGLALQNKIRTALMSGANGMAGTTVDFIFIVIITVILLAFFIKEVASMISQAQTATKDAVEKVTEELDAATEAAAKEAAKEAKYREDAFHYYLMQKFDLTQRESAVLRAFEEGASVREIAEREVVSESTIKTHLSNVYPKLAVKTRKEALTKIQSEREHFFNL